MIKEISYGLLIGGLIVGGFELLRPAPHTCITPEREASITDGCDTWKMRVSCTTKNEWDFRYQSNESNL